MVELDTPNASVDVLKIGCNESKSVEKVSLLMFFCFDYFALKYCRCHGFVLRILLSKSATFGPFLH